MLGGCIAVDIDDKKLQMAMEYGATHTTNSAKENVQERIREITKGAMCDFVIEGTGIPRLLNQCIYYLKNGGRLVLMSSHERACDSFDFRLAIERGITLHVAHPASCKNQDDAFCVLESETGIVGTLEASWSHYGRCINSTCLYFKMVS